MKQNTKKKLQQKLRHPCVEEVKSQHHQLCNAINGIK